MSLLKEFYDNKEQRDAVLAYILETLDDMAIRRVYNKEDTEGIADARRAIEETFAKLHGLYKPKEVAKPINRAR